MQWSGLIAAIALAGAAAACGNTSNDKQGPAALSGAGDPDAPALTVTGCVQAGDPAGTFVLTNARAEHAAGTTGTGSGREGSGGTTSSGGGTTTGSGGRETGGGGAGTIGNDLAFSGVGRTFRLIDDANVDFGKHEGRQVRVSGRVVTLESSTPAGTTGGERAPESRSPAGSTGGAGDPGGMTGGGNVGQGVESRSNQGSGAGRVLGGSSDRANAVQFLRVTALTKTADSCGNRN